MSDELSPETVRAIEDALAHGQKLDAIKLYREDTGKGLKESKEFIDSLVDQLIERDPERYAQMRGASSGCGTAVLLCAIALSVFGLASTVFADETQTVDKPEPQPAAESQTETLDIPEEYYEVNYQGWRWIVRRELSEDHAELWQQVRDELEHQLYQIERRVPAGVVKRLRQVPIWIELDSPKHPGLVYHPSRDWLANNDMLPQKARCVEISNARNFVNWTLHQPYCVLHEMAHAWHHQVLPEGFGNKDVLVCYQRAKSTGLYDEVLRSSGRNEKAYALNNQQEYFAETSEAFFGVNDFYPFLKAELQTHDPDMHSLLERLWTPEAGQQATANKKPTGAEQPVGVSD